MGSLLLKLGCRFNELLFRPMSCNLTVTLIDKENDAFIITLFQMAVVKLLYVFPILSPGVW